MSKLPTGLPLPDFKKAIKKILGRIVDDAFKDWDTEEEVFNGEGLGLIKKKINKAFKHIEEVLLTSYFRGNGCLR